mmetsp:Transcript_2986/g.7471  ORF Transcript_2986/g.7471 Transcript_2986/m.7471 type:complete len:283 (-) Transcript_2986:136-984(-)
MEEAPEAETAAKQHGGAVKDEDAGGVMKAKGKIQVDILWGIGHIWDAEDVARLKSEHNIHGWAVGSCPDNRQQNDVHGLPVQIQPEAVAYLLEKGVAEVRSERGAAGEGPPELDADFLAQFKARKDHVEFPLVGERPVVSVAGHGGTRLEVEPKKLAAYRSLMAKGYTITDGRKFGANYLVYDGSPKETHAFLTLRAAARHKPLDPLKIIAAARVAHGARKFLTIASCAEGEGEGFDEGDVRFLTFSPEGGFPKSEDVPSEDADEGEEAMPPPPKASARAAA